MNNSKPSLTPALTNSDILRSMPLADDRAVLDLQIYRPTAIIAIDLVRHSSKPKTVAQRARRILEDVFRTHLKNLDIAEAQFNYTGDGYLCALLGDSSSRLLDYLNAVIPALLKELAPIGQQFRAGADFGLVHFRLNSLTRDLEHFDTPGIVASRLEQTAQPNEILASDTVRQIFGPLHPEAFSDQPRIVRTKDRELVCYSLTVVDFADVRRTFRDAIFPVRVDGLTQEERGSLLIVDDDVNICSGLDALCKDLFVEVVTAETGRDAMREATAGRFSIILLDLNLPDCSGVDLVYTLLDRDPALVIVMMSGVGTIDSVQESLLLGASYFLQKPFDFSMLWLVLDRCIGRRAPSAVREKLDLLCDDVGEALRKIQKVSDRFELLTRRDDSDPAISLLRHKARGIADDFLDRLRPGCDIHALLDSLFVQLGWLNRMDATIHRARVKDVSEYLKRLARDYQVLHPGARLDIRGDLFKGQATIHHISLYVLALCELIDNAIAAVGASGTITVDTSILEAAGLLHTRISDSGQGVPVAMRESVFAGGTSTKGVGHGMGLSLVHDAVTRLGGTIHYAFDDRSTFTMTVPLLDFAGDKLPSVAQNRSRRRRPKRSPAVKK